MRKRPSLKDLAGFTWQQYEDYLWWRHHDLLEHFDEMGEEERRRLAEQRSAERCLGYGNRPSVSLCPGMKIGGSCDSGTKRYFYNEDKPMWIDLTGMVLPYTLKFRDSIGPTRSSVYPLDYSIVNVQCPYMIPDGLDVKIKIAKQNLDYTWGAFEDIQDYEFNGESAIITHDIIIEEPGFYKIKVVQTKTDNSIIENYEQYFLIGALPSLNRLSYPELTDNDPAGTRRGGVALHKINGLSKSLARTSNGMYQVSWKYNTLKDRNNTTLEISDRKFLVTAVYTLPQTPQTRNIAKNTKIYTYKVVSGNATTATFDFSTQYFTQNTEVLFYVQPFSQWRLSLWKTVERIQNAGFLADTSVLQQSGFSFSFDGIRTAGGIINTGDNIRSQLFLGSDLMAKNVEAYPPISNKKLFDKDSFSQFFKGNTLSLLEQAADQWMSTINFDDFNYRLIQSIYPNFNGISINRIIIDTPIMGSGRAKSPTKTKIRFVPSAIFDLDSMKQNTISMNMHINVGGSSYTNYINNKNAILAELYEGDEKIGNSIFGPTIPTNQEILNIFIHALGHGLGIGTFWNMPRVAKERYEIDSPIKHKYHYDNVMKIGPSLHQNDYPNAVRAYNEYFVNVNRGIASAPPYIRKSARSLMPIDNNFNFITTVNEKELLVSHWTKNNVFGFKGVVFPAPTHDVMSGVGSQISSISQGYLKDIGYQVSSSILNMSETYSIQSVGDSGDLCSFNYVSLPEKVISYDRENRKIFVYDRETQDPDPFEETSSDIFDIQTGRYVYDTNKDQWIHKSI